VREDIEKQFSIKKNDKKKTTIKIMTIRLNIKIKCREMKLKNKINSIKDSKSNILQLKKR
jgi:hypothetical protein